MSSCTVCPRAAGEGLHACPHHAAELRAWLAELPVQAELLAACVASSASPAQGRRGGGRAHSPAPVDWRVLALLGPGHPDARHPDDDGTAPIRPLLDAWAGTIAYTHPATYRDPHGTAHTTPCEAAHPRHGDTITGWCTWLTAYLPYALTQEWVGDLHHQVGDLVHRARAITGHHPHRRPYTAAPCPQCRAYGLVAVDGQPGLLCDTCGHHLPHPPTPERTPAS
ncbi:hypothetical protein [Streptomyces sp. NPDC006997]|uniref:hypothetical protein n=1 Tax=Streptomyces sp. NPDC006997 TaxID=3155356 RepID=UPI0033F69FB3